MFASVLYYLGIQFYEYKEDTLEKVCAQKGLNVLQVMHNLETQQKAEEENLRLMAYPMDLLIAYLKHTHYLFIKRDLPFIASLIEHLYQQDGGKDEMLRDLKTLFPLFVEDFVKHIYEEEDQLFTYVHLLHAAMKGKMHPGRLYYAMENHGIGTFAEGHEVHDDEMEGIRQITNNYQQPEAGALELDVLFSELQRFEKRLLTHAQIENEVLFPKALGLEKRVQRKMAEIAKMN